MRFVKPAPAPVVPVCTTLAPMSRSFALVVVTAPLLLVVPFPIAAAVTSSGLTVSRPLYSRTTMSGNLAATLKVTVTLLAPAAAAGMFLA